MNKYDGFDDRDAMIASFEYSYGEVTDEVRARYPTDDQILLAIYEYGNYEGSAFVLYEQDGKLYEVNGGHCSCNGLEGQWDPEETTWEALAMRQFYGSSWIQDEIKRLMAERVAA